MPPQARPGSLSAWANYFARHPRQAFILDGAGALLSALLLGRVLPMLQPAIGLGAGVLRLFAIMALLLVAFDAAAAIWAGRQWRKWLGWVVLLNGFYAGFTLAILLYQFRTVGWLGWLYFGAELTVLLLLIQLERKIMNVPPQSGG